MTANGSFQTELVEAEAAYRSKSFGRAYQIYSELGNMGHVDSQIMAGWMSLGGLGVPKSETAASGWFERAASLGSASGQFYYARLLTKFGDHTLALRHYASSARGDYLPAIFWVGYSLARGLGTNVDTRKAYSHLKVAARRGHMQALRELGVLDVKGERGQLFRIVGILEFLSAVIGAFLLAFIKNESDRLRA